MGIATIIVDTFKNIIHYRYRFEILIVKYFTISGWIGVRYWSTVQYYQLKCPTLPPNRLPFTINSVLHTQHLS